MIQTECNSSVYSAHRDHPLYREYLPQFVKSLPGRRRVLEDCFMRGDWTDLDSAAHQLKGTAGIFGFDELSQMSARLVELCQFGGRSRESIRRQLNEMIAYMDRMVH